MWGSWGDIVFELFRTPQEFRHSNGVELKEQPLFGKKKSVHFVGFKNRTTNLILKVFKSDYTPSVEDYINELEQKMISKEVNPLIVGDTNLGNFAIENFEVNYKQTDQYGKLVYAEVSLTFKEVPDGTLDRQ